MSFKVTSNIRILKDAEFKKFEVSRASLEKEAKEWINSCASLLPDSFDPSQNLDILPVVFDLAIVNQFNLNNDGITALDAAKMLPLFAHKPINIEHESTAIVGHLVKASFSLSENSFEETNPLDFLDLDEPFYIGAIGFIYRSVYPNLAKVIEKASDENDETYQAYAASCEISFEKYDLGIGRPKIKDAEIISRDDPRFGSYASYLKNKGGTGFLNGKSVNRILKGKKFPIGCALTENPAAKVKGIYSLASDNNFSKKNEKTVTVEEIQSKSINLAMDEKQFNEFKTLVSEIAKAGQSDGFTKIENALTEFGRDWKSSSDKNKEALDKSIAEVESLKAKVTSTQEELSLVKENLKRKQSSEVLNNRMSAIASLFQLSEDEEKFVAQEVVSLAEDKEAFEGYMAKMNIFFAHRNKDAIAKASVKEVPVVDPVTPVIETETPKVVIANNNAGAGENLTLLQRIKKEGLQFTTK